MVNEGRTVSQWLLLCILFSALISLRKTEGKVALANLNIIESAVAKGAVCLDGSPPAYNFEKGFGTGINNWLIHLEGGGWCNNVTTCLSRKTSRLGSSKQMGETLPFSGILGGDPKFNPDFYNWNRVKVRYCDGSSFTGDIEEVNPTTNLHFRGARIFSAVMEDLLAKGMKDAQNAMISGCSAGGLAAMMHCDKFRALLPLRARVKCLSDGGYFIHAKDISGAQHIESFFNDVVTLHGSAKNLPEYCTSKMNPSLCFFPQYVTDPIQAPLFLVNSAIDSWQIRQVLAPKSSDPQGKWIKCKMNISNCSASQLKTIEGFRLEFLNAMNSGGRSSSRGFFINSCYDHCQTEMQEVWLRQDSPVLANERIGKAVGDWFYDRNPFHEVDCPYPCDKSCKNRIYSEQNL